MCRSRFESLFGSSRGLPPAIPDHAVARTSPGHPCLIGTAFTNSHKERGEWTDGHRECRADRHADCLIAEPCTDPYARWCGRGQLDGQGLESGLALGSRMISPPSSHILSIWFWMVLFDRPDPAR